MININGLEVKAPSKSKCNNLKKALVNPQPIQLKPKIDFQIQGIKISIEVSIFKSIDRVK